MGVSVNRVPITSERSAMNLIRSSCEVNKIPYSYITKLLYGQYPYSITLAFPFRYWREEINYDGRRWNLDYAKNRETTHKVKTAYMAKRNAFLVDTLGQVGQDVEYKFSHQSLTLYFIEEEHAIGALDNVKGPRISMVKLPKNPSQLALINQHPTKVVKSALWHGAYRYRITIHRTFRDDTPERIRELFGGSYMTVRGTVNQKLVIRTPVCRYHEGMAAMFLNEPEDIVLLRLALGDKVHKIEECIVS